MRRLILMAALAVVLFTVLLQRGMVPLPAAAQREPFHLLALSWEPAFCETKPHARECRSQTAERLDAKQLSLHGLWPQPSSNAYCGVAPDIITADKLGRWRDLPELKLSENLAKLLLSVMPGAQSLLDRHEWIKHGTCHAQDAGAYYRHALALTLGVNRPEINALFSAHSGRYLASRDIRAVFDKAFGEGAGDRVRVACARDGRRLLIAEITIGLGGEINDKSSLEELLAAAPMTRVGCPGGIVDPVGQQ